MGFGVDLLSMMQDMLDYMVSKYNENCLIFACVGITIIWILIEWLFNNPNKNPPDEEHYSYDGDDGPQTWPQKYPLANGNRQSPINLVFNESILCLSDGMNFLKFSNIYEAFPSALKLHNSGHNIVLYYEWNNCERPKVCGGPLNEPYIFVNAKFRWGWNAVEGTEHMIDGRRSSMELQLMFVKMSAQNYDIDTAADTGSILYISYIYKEEPAVDNPYLEEIVTALDSIQSPILSTYITPFPISLLAPAFLRKYFYYMGSLTFPPCTEGVLWIVQPEPIVISSRQADRFRSVFGFNGILNSTNVRPVQNVNQRDVIFYN